MELHPNHEAPPLNLVELRLGREAPPQRALQDS